MRNVERRVEPYLVAVPVEKMELRVQRQLDLISKNNGRYVRVAGEQELHTFKMWKKCCSNGDDVSWQDFYEEVAYGFRNSDGSKCIPLPISLVGKTLDDVREETRASEISVYF